MKKNKSGFTFVELLIVVAIMAILLVILIGMIDPMALVGKTNDSQRKRDLDRIKKSFEEYFNDKGTYPLDVASWNIKSNCKTSIFDPYLKPWPCDPDGEPYYIWVDNSGKYFRILTELENKTDKVIPIGWYDQDTSYMVDGYTIDQVNYGVSSSNINWNTYTLSASCSLNCYQLSAAGKCNSAISGCNDADGLTDCYRNSDCNASCKVHCCGAGCN